MKDVLRLTAHFSFSFKGVTVKNTKVNSTPAATPALVGVRCQQFSLPLLLNPRSNVSTVQQASTISVLSSKAVLNSHMLLKVFGDLLAVQRLYFEGHYSGCAFSHVSKSPLGKMNTRIPTPTRPSQMTLWVMHSHFVL